MSDELLKSQIVRVYQNPHSDEDLEGTAKLIKKMDLDDDGDLEWWVVEFIEEPGSQYSRKVADRHAVKE